MNVNGNQTQLKFTPRLSRLYEIEVSVLADSEDGNVIDRAAFLTFDAQPTTGETGRNQIIALELVVALVALIIAWERRRRRAGT